MNAKEFHICICDTCKEKIELPWKEFMDHCQKVHGVVKGEAGSRISMMHLDAKDWFEWRYSCNFGEKVKFTEICRQLRRGQNKEMWR